MTDEATPGNPRPRHRADRELSALFGIFGLLWALVGLGIYGVFPGIRCAVGLGADAAAQCGKALGNSFLDGAFHRELLEKKLEAHRNMNDPQGIAETAGLLINEGMRTSDMYKVRADAFVELKKTDEARYAYLQAVALSPHDPDIFGTAAAFLLSERKFSDGLHLSEGFARDNPNLAIAHSWLGWFHYRDKNYRPAIAAYEKAIGIDGNDQWLRKEMGDILGAAGRDEEAVASYSEAIRLNEEYTEAIEARAALYSSMRRHTDAQADYKRLLKEDRSSWALAKLARSYIESADYNAADPLITEALKSDSKNEVALDARIRFHIYQGELDKARLATENLLKELPDNAYGRYWHASLDYREKNFEKALAGYRSVAKDWPEDYGLQIDIGDVLYDLRRDAEALQSYNKAVELAPRISGPYTARARIHLAMKNWKDAITDANAALHFEPTSGVALARKAYAEWSTSDMASARRDYDEAVRHLDSDHWVRFERIEFLIASKSLAEAREEITALLAADAQSSEALRLKDELARAEMGD